MTSVATPASPKTPWMFYPQKQGFFYSAFCRKYKCIDNGGTREPGFELEKLGLGDARYAGFFDLTAVRSRLGTSSMWPSGVHLLVDPKVRYDSLTVNSSKNYIDSDTYTLISDLMNELIGKTYSKQQIIRCFLTNEKSVGYYYLDEFLKFPSTVPISKISSQQGAPLHLNVMCGREKNKLLNISL